MKKLLMSMVLIALVAALSGCAILPLLLTAQPRESGNEVSVENDVLYEEGEYFEPSEEYALSPQLSTLAPADGMAFESNSYYDMGIPEDFNTEEYASIRENGFTRVATSPLSTFSADVDTASYCNLRRMLNDGYTLDYIPAGAVRVEEMLNYFRYDIAQPQEGSRFGVTAQIADCPWNADTKLLMVGVRAGSAEEAASEGSNLVFLVDVSGSMASSDKLGLAQRALKLLAQNLTEKDTVSIVTYSDGERIVIEGANPVRDSARLNIAIDSLEAGGYTDGQRGLEQAYDVAMRYYRPHGNNRVIMCSDGDLNVGITSESELHDYVSEKKETGVYLSVLGFGDGNYKDTKMETLADDGNGNYYYIDSILEARKVLVEEMTQTIYAVADDVKFQIEFNPARVAEYRQIGYENRALADEDFNDDTKDAGEVGSDAAVIVMYELKLAGEGSEEGGLKYQTSELTEAATGDEWLTLSIRYKEPGGQTSALETYTVGEADVTDAPSGDFLFASAVAEFGMILRNSEFKGDSTYDTVLDLLKRAELNDDYREEFFSLVKIAERAGALEDMDD